MMRGSLACADAKDTTMSIDPESEPWVVRDKNAQIETYNGKRAICLQGGYAYLNDVDFRNGVIECDLASPVARSYLGIMFRVQSEENYELIYFQPHTSGKWDAVQYDPVFNGSTTWQLHHGPKYQAEAIVPTQEWFHVKIVVSGVTAEVYLHNAEAPALVVRDLRHGLSEGSVGFWSHHPGSIANLTVTRLSSPKRARAPFGPSPKLPYLTHCSVSEPTVFKTPGAPSLLEAAAGTPSAEWRTVTSEESGIVNLNRHFRKPPGEATVLAKLALQSETEQSRKLTFGYSDKITVFLNGLPIYSGDNSYGVSKQSGARGYVRDGEFSIDLPLRKGSNEFLLAVSEKAFGWGFIARLDKAVGIHVEGQASAD